MTPTVSFVSPYIVVALLSTFAGAALAWLVVRRNDAAIRAGDAERHASALAAARDEYERSLDDARAASERFFAEIRTQRSAAENDRDRAREQRAAALAELAAARQAEADARAQLAQTRDQFASERASLLEQVGQRIVAENRGGGIACVQGRQRLAAREFERAGRDASHGDGARSRSDHRGPLEGIDDAASLGRAAR